MIVRTARAATVLFVLAAFAVGAAPAALPKAERAKIESLIAAVAKLDGAVFVRNGKAYPPKTAARFLRGKWDDRSDDVLSAHDFIEKVATRSSTTGRAYLVRYADGREIPTAAFLRSQLEKSR
jgi:HD superfamily phosphodiesterase